MFNSVPIKGRATPYVEPRQECFLNLNSGVVFCQTQESAGQLPCAFVETPVAGIVDVSRILDSPLNRIIQRQRVGPWELVGYVTNSSVSETGDRSMFLYAQAVDTRRTRYNYRVVDNNGVPIDTGEKIVWISDGESLTIPGYSNTYTVHLYQNYR